MLADVLLNIEMSYRRRSKDITTPVAQLAALIVLALVFIPQVRLYALVLLVVGVGVGLGLLRNLRRTCAGIQTMTEDVTFGAATEIGAVEQ